jgi:hypothetical protein
LTVHRLHTRSSRQKQRPRTPSTTSTDCTSSSHVLPRPSRAQPHSPATLPRSEYDINAPPKAASVVTMKVAPATQPILDAISRPVNATHAERISAMDRDVAIRWRGARGGTTARVRRFATQTTASTTHASCASAPYATTRWRPRRPGPIRSRLTQIDPSIATATATAHDAAGRLQRSKQTSKRRPGGPVKFLRRRPPTIATRSPVTNIGERHHRSLLTRL